MTIELIVDSELKLIQFRPEDSVAIFALIDKNRDHLSQHNDDTASKYPSEGTVYQSIINPKNPQRLRFGIWRGNTLLGSINLTPDREDARVAEVGYYLGEEFQGQRVMTRALKRLASYGFDELYLKEIYANVAAKKIASRAVLFGSGFTLDHCISDSCIYSRKTSFGEQ